MSGTRGELRSAPKNIECYRWVKKGKHWSLVIESVTPAKYLERFKEWLPWRKGARVRKPDAKL